MHHCIALPPERDTMNRFARCRSPVYLLFCFHILLFCFYLRVALHSAVFAVEICPSVHLSVTHQFQGEPRQWGPKYTGVEKIEDFRQKSSFISETVRDRPMVTMER